MTSWIPGFHFEVPSEARGVTDPGVGCTAWLGIFFIRDNRRTLTRTHAILADAQLNLRLDAASVESA